MATLLAFFTEGNDEHTGFTNAPERATLPVSESLTPTLEIIDGKYLPSKFFREELAPKWTTL